MIAANIKKAYFYLKKNGFKDTFYASCERLHDTHGMQYCFTPISEVEYEKQKNSRFERAPLISILVPMYETKEEYAKAMIESVCNQTYHNWELILADASLSDKVERLVKQYQDKRIKYVKVAENKGISNNTNVALNEATGDYIGLLDHDDLLTPNALFEMAACIAKGIRKGIRYAFIYSDEDKCDENAEKFFEPNIKLSFNYDMLLTNNYICHFLVMNAKLMKKLMFRSEYDGAQDYDLVLRALLKKEEGMQVGHVDKVLYHWRCHSDSTAANPRSKQYAYEAGKNAIEDFLKQKKISATVLHSKHNGFYRIDYGVNKGFNLVKTEHIFKEREDIKAVAGSVFERNRITSGIMDKNGNCPFFNLKKNYSGYLHRASLQQDCYAADIRNMALRKEMVTEWISIINSTNKEILKQDITKENSDKQISISPLQYIDDEKVTREEVITLSLKLGKAIREAGGLILWDPFFKEK